MPRKKKPQSDIQQTGQDIINIGQDIASLGIGLALLTPDQADSFVPLTTRDQWKQVPGKRQYYYTQNPMIVISYRKYKQYFNKPKTKKYGTWMQREFASFPPAVKFFDKIDQQDIIYVKAFGIPYKSSPPIVGKKKPPEWRTVIAPAYKFMHTGSEIEPRARKEFSLIKKIVVLWKKRP